MKKQILLLAMILLPLVASADSVEIGGIYYDLISKSKEAWVTNNPNYYKGDVIIPESINYEGIDYKVSTIKEKAFYECRELTSISIPNTVVEIGESAFRGCGINQIVVPETVCAIGNECFSDCTKLITATLPNSITRIPQNAFGYCYNLSSIVIPESVKSIDDGAFLYCMSLNNIELPKSIKIINSFSFSNCTKLSSIIIPDSVEQIKDWAFENCTSLSSISFPNSVKSIYSKSFKGCSSLNSITFGWELYSIAVEAFASCINLEKIYCYAENVPKIGDETFYNSQPELISLYVRESLIDKYKESSNWKIFKVINKLEIPKHILIYMVDGENYKSYELEEGITIIPESTPYKEGCTFSGWSEIPQRMLYNDIVVTGSFTINTYKLTYYVDGVEYKSYDVEYGETITPEEEPRKEGYTFSGWSEIPERMPSHNVTVTGTFTPSQKCGKPAIHYEYGRLTFTCDTEGVEYVTEITDSDIKKHYESEITLTATYNISVYAKKDGFAISDVSTATLCWIDVEPNTDGITNGVANVPAKAMLIQNEGGILKVEGVDDGTPVSIYTLDGKQVGNAISRNGAALVGTNILSGNTVIMKIGVKSVKVIMK